MRSTMKNQHLESPPSDEAISLARASAEELGRLLANTPSADRAHVQMGGQDLILPKQALHLLKDLLAEMAQGNIVTLVPIHLLLTTQEAANLLNVSRPYLIQLLKEGKIPFTTTGTHRRIRYQDLMAYKHGQGERSRKALDELTAQAQEHDMGY
ncbi:MAG: helix-turn-helix domain-containing protein [Deltaproteobacteria bacterium]|nr:helix-turn-helix domain-containing protein [Deltaproteobacteria bacterium]